MTLAVGAQVYDVLPSALALGVALGVGGLATSLALRWESQGIAALGIVGALISPVLAGAPWDGGTMAILLIAAASAVGVVLHQRWEWLSFGVFLITVPQWGTYLAQGPPAQAVIAVLTGFGLLGAAAAVGYELRAGAQTIRTSSVFLLSLNALALAAAGWLALSEAPGVLANLWLAGLAVAHVGIGLWTTRSGRTSHAFGQISLVIGAVLADAAFVAFVDGPARALGWAGAGVMFAVLIRRARPQAGDEALAALGLGAHVALALLQSVTSDAPPTLLEGGGAVGIAGTISLMGVAAGCLVSARLAEAGNRGLRICLEGAGLAVVAYLTALTLDGALLTLAWSVEAMALAKLASRTDDEVTGWSARAHVMLASAHATATVVPPVALMEGATEPLAAVVALGGASAAAAICAWLTDRALPEVRGSLVVTAMAAAAYLAVATLDGAVLVVALSGAAVLLSEMARRAGAELPAFGALAYLGGALAHVLVFEAQPSALVAGADEPAAAAISLGALVLAAVACGRPGGTRALPREWLLGGAAVTALYLASVLVVSPFQPGNPAPESSLLALGIRQQGQVLLSVLWSIAGCAALVLGLRRDLQVVRMGALALLLLTVGKVFLFDLATLTSVYRVASFIGLGLFLLTAAFAWQRMRPRPLPDLREAPAGVR